jgi:predicted PurR-regulated permease PerM
MGWKGHARTTGAALKNWFIAQAYDALAVGALWLAGLYVLGVPLWWLWGLLAVGLQFVPWFGPILSLIGPAIAGSLAGGWWMLLHVLFLYAVVAVVDGFVFQPYFLKRTARVPIWASILAPIVLGLVFNIWGVILAPPLLAVLYAFRKPPQQPRVPPPRSEERLL